MAQDYYKVLGLGDNASADEIKKAFRTLAKKYHPDRNKGDKSSEDRFKEISEAYETLSDPGKKSEYDTLRKYGAFSGGGPGRAQNSGDFSQFYRSGPGAGQYSFRMNSADGLGEFEDILSQLFGGKAGFGFDRADHGAPFSGKPARGADIAADLTVTFMEAVKGTVKTITLRPGDKKLRIKIPRGIENGGKIRLAGQGQPGYNGQNNGDLIITVNVMTDQNFERKGNDIHTSVMISFIDAINGTKVQVRTLTKTIMLTIPAGTQPGTQLRLKGMGLNVGDFTGDQYVTINVRIPQNLTDRQKELLDEWKKEGH